MVRGPEALALLVPDGARLRHQPRASALWRWLMLQHLTRAVWSVVLRRVLENLTRPLPWLALRIHSRCAPSSPDLFLGRSGSRGLGPGAGSQVGLAQPGVLQHPGGGVPGDLGPPGHAAGADLGPSGSIGRPAPRTTACGPSVAGGWSSWGSPRAMPGFDWLMSLDPHWASTMYGVYCLGRLAGELTRGPDPL